MFCLILTTNVSKPPSLFALIIGIDEYKSSTIDTLCGAVADAKAVKRYLEGSLGVLTSQMATLYNAEATRDTIVQSIRALQTDPRILKDDPILIFYAGHGGTISAPSGWDAGSDEIQILVSYDAGCKTKGRTVCGIPDRTLNFLLHQLSKEKGNNVTVIFDCCHAGSLTRNDRSRLVRGVKLDIDVPSDLDDDILKYARVTSVPPKFLTTDLSSHVLLAACGQKEKAKENPIKSRGEFTMALLNTLMSVGADQVTYKDLIQRLPILPDQNPQCEGHHQNDILFRSKAPSHRCQLYAVRVDDGEYILEAGSVHGVTKGSTFDIYPNRDSVVNKTPLTRLTASEAPNPFSTVLSGDGSKIGIEAFALQTGAGAEEDLFIHVALDSKLESVFRALAAEIKENKTGQRQIRIVEEDQIATAHLDVASENGKIIFNILDSHVTIHGLDRMPFQLDCTVDDIRLVIRAAAHYYWHLHRTRETKFLRNVVKIEFMRLKDNDEEVDDEAQDDEGRDYGCSPDGPELIQEGVVDIVVDDDAIYGMKLKNTFGEPLYASVFYFDNSDLSIMSYFQPPTAKGTVDPPLLPYQSLTLGYGAGGGLPFTYSLRDGQDIDVGFIKIFLSTEQVDLSVVPQKSPFSKDYPRGVDISEKPRGLWETILITIVQRRNAPH
ncbi:hypothetical protein M408DRAFT_137083 [Serendipita vermifera MAFF 305830]|uniref:Peptidase C14 caspase domain-containing protein n=1 Tax=Serendipita vermifera MAFF 305830 TaxID=933852 RepID=A0A0C3AVQ6_SERVB|nr:hypothetical protein M408DRAFT_137083 [Serendipita vermifera MAFF 305830]